jgi:hypothetical protein
MLTAKFAACSFQWSILLGVSPINPSEGALRARYFACCCLASAGYSNIPLISAFLCFSLCSVFCGSTRVHIC